MLYERKKGLVSVVVSNYNKGPYLRECLDSIANQTYTHLELILIDDASTDRSSEEVKNWLNQTAVNPKSHLSADEVQYIQLPRNVGFAGAISIGQWLAKGEYIAMQDSDDISHPQRIAKQVAFLEKKPDIGLVGTNYSWFHDGQFQKQHPVYWLHYGANIIKTYRSGGHCICHGTILFRGDCFDRLGGPTRRFKGAEDYEFIAACVRSGVQVENLKDVLYYYRKSDNQRSRQFYGKERS
jgi:glycosyltransferase involved in cell wall biosynthesis